MKKNPQVTYVQCVSLQPALPLESARESLVWVFCLILGNRTCSDGCERVSGEKEDGRGPIGGKNMSDLTRLTQCPAYARSDCSSISREGGWNVSAEEETVYLAESLFLSPYSQYFESFICFHLFRK